MRFQQEHDRKVEPYAVRIGATQDEGWPASTDEDQQHAPQIQPRRHEQAAEGLSGGAVAEAVQRVGGLMDGKDEIKQVDEKSGAENAFKCGAPASPAPDARFGFGGRLSLDSAPTGAERKSDKSKK